MLFFSVTAVLSTINEQVSAFDCHKAETIMCTDMKEISTV